MKEFNDPVFNDEPGYWSAVRLGDVREVARRFQRSGMRDVRLLPDWLLGLAFTDPVIDGKGVRGYGAYAFRTDDKAFADAFNAELAKFIGTEEHKKLVAPFGFTPEELPKDVTAAKLCAAN